MNSALVSLSVFCMKSAVVLGNLQAEIPVIMPPSYLVFGALLGPLPQQERANPARSTCDLFDARPGKQKVQFNLGAWRVLLSQRKGKRDTNELHCFREYYGILY